MFIILLSPIIALIVDNTIGQHNVPKRLLLFLIISLILPSILLELSGYSFSDRQCSYVAITMFLTGVQLALFVIVRVRQTVKVVASIVLLCILGFIAFGASFLANWGGGPNVVLKEAKFGNYKALTLEPPLYSSDTVLRVKKTALAGILQKVFAVNHSLA